MLLALVKIPTSKGMMHGKLFLHKVESAKAMTLIPRMFAIEKRPLQIKRDIQLMAMRKGTAKV